MLSNQLIGAGQNVAAHAQQPKPVPVVQTGAVLEDAPPPPVSGAPAMTGAAATTAPVQPKSETATIERAPLELPKRAELAVAVPDTMPDATPESIYMAKALAS